MMINVGFADTETVVPWLEARVLKLEFGPQKISFATPPPEAWEFRPGTPAALFWPDDKFSARTS